MSEQQLVFTAVQEDATSFVMDWPVIEADETSEFQFKGTVFVLDGAGVLISDTPLAAPSDRTADDALNSIGWSRIDGWHPDAFGRRTSTVTAIVRSSTARLPQQRSAPSGIGSLAEEASMHLS